MFEVQQYVFLYLLVTNIILNLEKLCLKSCYVLQNIRTPSSKSTREKNLLIGGQKLNISQRHNAVPKQNKSGCGRNRCCPIYIIGGNSICHLQVPQFKLKDSQCVYTNIKSKSKALTPVLLGQFRTVLSFRTKVHVPQNTGFRNIILTAGVLNTINCV